MFPQRFCRSGSQFSKSAGRQICETTSISKLSKSKRGYTALGSQSLHSQVFCRAES